LFRCFGLIINEILEVAETEMEKEENYKKRLEQTEGKGADKDKVKRASSGLALLEIDTRSENLFSGDVEIDPSKMKGDQDAFTNMLALQLVVQKMLVQIKRSGPRVPPEFREIFSHIAVELRRKYPGAVTSTIGGFIFLRFINPAILLPESYGLSTHPPIESARRQLLLVTKVLQNLSNGVLFGKKEEFMISVNPFIEQNQKSCNDFLDELCNISGLENEGPIPVMPGNVYNGSLYCIYANAKQTKGIDSFIRTGANAELAKNYQDIMRDLDALMQD